MSNQLEPVDSLEPADMEPVQTEPPKKKTFWERIAAVKEYILGFGVIGVIIWWIIKILICIFAGICLL